MVSGKKSSLIYFSFISAQQCLPLSPTFLAMWEYLVLSHRTSATPVPVGSCFYMNLWGSHTLCFSHHSTSVTRAGMVSWCLLSIASLVASSEPSMSRVLQTEHTESCTHFILVKEATCNVHLLLLWKDSICGSGV